MGKISAYLVLAFSASVALGVSGFDMTFTRKPPLLRDGFVLRGVDGRLSGPDDDGAWHFEIASDVNDFGAVISAGAKLELLPSSALEKMIADGKTRSEMKYRLWNATVTRYRGRNFIFPTFFLPLSPVKKAEPDAGRMPQEQGHTEAVETPPAQERPSEPVVPDPNDVLNIPLDILQKLRDKQEKMATSVEPVRDSNGVGAGEPNAAGQDKEQPAPDRYSRGADSVFVDRTAFLVEENEGRFVFALDALGRNIRQVSLNLLPCEVLELAELKQSDELEPVRFKIAGILTRYEGRDYLLLQKAIKTYSHGNFGR